LWIGNWLIVFARKHTFIRYISIWTAEEVELTKFCLLNRPQGARGPEDGSDINYLFILFVYLFIYCVFSGTICHIKQCRPTGLLIGRELKSGRHILRYYPRN
jgi:hypothetical protein